MRHELKTEERYFKALWCGDKTFEIRKNDRNFEERDEIVLQEITGADHDYTGREIEGVITYLTEYEQQKGYCVFSFRETTGLNLDPRRSTKEGDVKKCICEHAQGHHASGIGHCLWDNCGCPQFIWEQS